MISTERLTTIIVDALPVEKYSIIKIQTIRYPDLGLEDTQNLIKTVIIHSERLSITKKRITSRIVGVEKMVESWCNCKNPGHTVRDCKTLARKFEMEK